MSIWPSCLCYVQRNQNDTAEGEDGRTWNWVLTGSSEWWNVDCWHPFPFILAIVGALVTKRRPDGFSKQSSDTQDTPHPLPRAFLNVAAHIHLLINPCHHHPLLITILPPFTVYPALSLRCPSQGQWLCSFFGKFPSELYPDGWS